MDLAPEGLHSTADAADHQVDLDSEHKVTAGKLHSNEIKPQ